MTKNFIERSVFENMLNEIGATPARGVLSLAKC
jgi:hypothetical protein